MRAPQHSRRSRRAAPWALPAPLALPAALALLSVLACTPRCGGPAPLPGPPETPVQTPVSPMPVQSPTSPATQSPTSPMGANAPTPVSPMPLPAWADLRVPAEAEAAPIELSPELLAQIQLGARFDEVQGLLNTGGETIADNNQDAVVMRWTDAHGNALIVRFENDRLVRHAALAPDGTPLPELPDAPGEYLTPERYAQLVPGVTLAEVSRLIPIPPTPIGGDRERMAIYRWVDDQGSSFIARFEEDRLVRKTALQIAERENTPDAGAAPASAGSQVSDPTSAADSDTYVVAAQSAATAQGEAAAAPAPEPAPRGQPVTVSAQPVEPPAPIRAQAEPQVVSVAPERPRVRVVGSTRREREAQARAPGEPTGAYRPKASFPDSRFSLRRGTYEIVLENPTEQSVKVGVRNAENGGEDISLPPGQTRSLFVDRGNYRFYYIFENAPYELNSGSAINIDGDRTADIVVRVVEEGDAIRDMTLQEFWDKPGNY